MVALRAKQKRETKSNKRKEKIFLYEERKKLLDNQIRYTTFFRSLRRFFPVDVFSINLNLSKRKYLNAGTPYNRTLFVRKSTSQHLNGEFFHKFPLIVRVKSTNPGPP